MPYKSPKYSHKINEQIRNDVFEALFLAKHSMTIDEIKTQKIALAAVTPQKIAKTLNEFVDDGKVMKAKRNNRMVYKLIRENENY